MTAGEYARDFREELKRIERAARDARDAEASDRTTLRRTIGAALREIRLAQRMSAAAFAASLGTTLVDYMDVEDGTSSHESSAIRWLEHIAQQAAPAN